MADITAHLQQNLAQAAALGQTERVSKLKARLAEMEEPEPAPEPAVKPTAKKPAAKPAAKTPAAKKA